MIADVGFSLENQKSYELAICAIFKEEALYLKEWIEFHKLQGVEHFFLYNNNSSDEYLEVLAPYIKKNEVTLVDWNYSYNPLEQKGNRTPWLDIQSSAYKNCIELYGNKAIWIAFIDVDEFLFCPAGARLPDFLLPYKEYGGLCVNWLLFGTSFLEDIPPGSLMIEALTRCAPTLENRNRGMKSIVQPCYVIGCKNAHSFMYKEGFFAITVDGKKTSPTQEYADGISHDKIRINHYWTRTESHFRNRKIASRKNRRNFEDEQFLRGLSVNYNKNIDTSILQFVFDLKKRMVYEE